jgi:hypothetical protein
MASRTPSYIYQSPHGIWYFQLRVPARYRQKCGDKKLIRKSLGTRNRQHALRLARRMWVEVEHKKYDWEDQADRDMAADERMYFRGKSLAAPGRRTQPEASTVAGPHPQIPWSKAGIQAAELGQGSV